MCVPRIESWDSFNPSVSYYLNFTDEKQAEGVSDLPIGHKARTMFAGTHMVFFRSHKN